MLPHSVTVAFEEHNATMLTLPIAREIAVV
jgi:hypothetical protein